MTSSKEINDVLQEELIRYSQVWEDYDMLVKGLKIAPDDNVLSIASAGCNALALLLQGPASVTAVDLNPSQTAIVHLKKAAISHLSHDQFVSLVGARAEHDRWSLYTSIRPHLPEYVQKFWDGNREILEFGLISCGRLETYFRVFQEKYIAKAAPPEVMSRFLNSEDLSFQVQFFDKVFSNPLFVEKFRAYTSRDNVAEHGRDHSQFKFVEIEDVGQYLHNRFRYVCTEQPTRGNFYLEFLLTGTYSDLDSGPEYLRPANYEKLKALMPHLHIETKGLIECLDDHPDGFYSKANLSDLFEYLSPEQTESFMRALATRMRPGGCLAYWNLMVSRARPESLSDWLQPQPELAKSLWINDRAFFYSAFHLDRITRP